MNPIAPPSLRGGFSQRFEEGPDPEGGHPEEHAVERRGGNEKERNAGFGSHRLRHVGLSGSGFAFEQDPSSGIPSQVVAKGLVREEDLQRAGYLLEEDVDPADVGESDPDLLGAEPDMRRTPVDNEGAQNPEPDHEDHGDREEPQDRIGSQRGETELDRVPFEEPFQEICEEKDAATEDPSQPALPFLLSRPGDVRAVAFCNTTEGFPAAHSRSGAGFFLVHLVSCRPGRSSWVKRGPTRSPPFPTESACRGVLL